MKIINTHGLNINIRISYRQLNKDKRQIQRGQPAFNSGLALCGDRCNSVLFFFILYLLRQFLHINPAQRKLAERYQITTLTESARYILSPGFTLNAS